MTPSWPSSALPQRFGDTPKQPFVGSKALHKRAFSALATRSRLLLLSCCVDAEEVVARIGGADGLSKLSVLVAASRTADAVTLCFILVLRAKGF